MSSLSIRNMNDTIRQRQQAQDEMLASLKPIELDPMHYWHYERKTKHGWKFVRDFIGSKYQAGEIFSAHFEPGAYRMRRMYSYT